MYNVSVSVKGTAPLLQHRFPMPDYKDMGKGGKKVTGAVDYTEEWREYFYSNGDGEIYQPASHFEASMIKAAVNFKITGKRGKTYKDLFKSAVFVNPEMIPHGIQIPDELDTDGDKPLYLDLRPVIINRARVVRIRPAFSPGWRLEFTIECLDDQINESLLHEVLEYAGKTVGVGDYRPRFGRFDVINFEVHD